MMRAERQGSSIARDLWPFGLALAVRLTCWFWFVGSGVQPLADERGYFTIAGGWGELLRRLATLSLPSPSLLRSAWGEARWPPLYPFLLGVARALPGDDLAAARLVGVIAGALTTIIVVHLTARLAGRRAAGAAGVAHALYPSFVFFSVALWSETLFILLLLALLSALLRAIDSQTAVTSGWAFWLGLGSALLMLTRSAALPMVVGLLGWLALRLPRGRRLPTIGGTALLALLLVLPWSAASTRLAGRPVFLSIGDGSNLALGNNPWTPPALGSAWGVEEFKRKVFEAVQDKSGGDRSLAIAREEILSHPLRTMQRVVVRAVQLAGLDFFPLRHLATVTLPPLPAWTLPGSLLLQWLSLALLLFLSGAGICGPEPVRHRALLLTMVIAGMAGPLATVAVPRLALPLLAVLLPAAGCGWTKLRQRPSTLRPAPLAILAAGSLLLPAATIRQVIEYHLGPSSHYAPALAPVAAAVGAAPVYTDLLACQPPQEAEALPHEANPMPGTARWVESESLPATARGSSSIRYLGLAASAIERPIALRTEAPGVEVAVTAPERWQHLLPIAGTPLRCSWEGAVFPLLE